MLTQEVDTEASCFEFMGLQRPESDTRSDGDLGNQRCFVLSKDGGEKIPLYIIHIFFGKERLFKNIACFLVRFLVEWVCFIEQVLKKYNFGLRKLQFVYDNFNSNSFFLLLEAKYKCKDDLKILKPLYIDRYLEGKWN